MRIAATISRYLLGIIFVVFGLNGFLNFIPQGPVPAGPALQLMIALTTTHYFAFVFAVQLVAGVLFLANRYVPLALTIIGPVIVNIILFHALMVPSGLPLAALVTILWFILFANLRPAFAGIFRARA
jgi:putative oxidoreductase